jgi:hypothetical protein
MTDIAPFLDAAEAEEQVSTGTTAEERRHIERTKIPF